MQDLMSHIITDATSVGPSYHILSELVVYLRARTSQRRGDAREGEIKDEAEGALAQVE
jgi:hypothetical protein